MNIIPDFRKGELGQVQLLALAVGAAALAVCIIGAFFSPQQFFRAYLAAYLFYFGLGLGCLAVLMIYHLTGGAWGFLLRRPLEAATRTIPLLALLFIPIACGVGWLYVWAMPEMVAIDKNIQYKQMYLNVPFWCGRAVLFFALWVGLTYLLNSWSRRQDETGDPQLGPRLAYTSGIGLILYGVTITFASVDWVMSLQPSFRSTIFGPLVAAGQVLSGHALVVLVLTWLVVRPPVSNLVSLEALNDVGNLLFSFLIIWAYMVWFQFMLIWIANQPYDNHYYVARMGNAWEAVAWFLFVFHFVLPFFMLLSRDVKRNPRLLAAMAGLLLFTQLVYDYYEVMPWFKDTTIAEHWMDFLTPVAVGGPWLAYFLWQLQRYPMLPRHDQSEKSALHLRHLDEEEAARQQELSHG